MIRAFYMVSISGECRKKRGGRQSDLPVLRVPGALCFDRFACTWTGKGNLQIARGLSEFVLQN